MALKIKRDYQAHLDDRRRLTLKDARHRFYFIVHYTNDIFLGVPCAYKLANKVSEQEVRKMDRMIRQMLSKWIDFDKDENE